MTVWKSVHLPDKTKRKTKEGLIVDTMAGEQTIVPFESIVVSGIDMPEAAIFGLFTAAIASSKNAKIDEHSILYGIDPTDAVMFINKEFSFKTIDSLSLGSGQIGFGTFTAPVFIDPSGIQGPDMWPG